MTTFDYIVVGAGSSGCVLAERLSADSRSNVLLLEAGSDNETELVRMPRAFMKMWGNPRHFWSYPVNAQEGRPAGETWFSGRGLGGSSSTNGTWYMRGEPADYDAWNALGLSEWSWTEVERCYREMERYRAVDAHESRGRNGLLQVSKLPFRSRFFDASIEAGRQMGWPFLPDINTPGAQGVGYSQASVTSLGRRASAYRMFLKPAMRRRNLTVITGALVECVETKNGVVSAVRYRRNGSTERAESRREVIVAAGALQSPKLLQLSGIGPPEILARAGVALVVDAPAVGQNLVDHVTFSLSFRMKGYAGFNREFGGWRVMRHVARYYTSGTGLMAFTCPEVTAMASMDCEPHWPNVQIGVGPFSMRSFEDMKADPGRGALESLPGYTLNGYYLRPKSRGSIAIRSSDVSQPIEINANWWSNPDDRRALVQMFRLMRRYAAQSAFSPYTVHEVTPGSEHESDEQIARVLEWLAGPGLHPTGTCRMGALPNSVLDSRLRVRGIRGLRVADCSAMPTPPSGNTNAPAMMLGHRAAELILEDAKRGS